jgi:hypothetical protein
MFDRYSNISAINKYRLDYKCPEMLIILKPFLKERRKSISSNNVTWAKKMS